MTPGDRADARGPADGNVMLYSILSTSAKGVMCAGLTTVDTGSQN